MIVLGLLAQAAPAADGFGVKEILIILASIAANIIVVLTLRGWGKGDAELDLLRIQLNRIEYEKIDEIQKAIFRLELDVSNIKGLTEPLAQAVRLNLAALVPRSNPLTEDTNRITIRWQMGDYVEPQELLAAAEEVMYEAREDPKLTEAEKVTFSLTGASMHHDAIKAMNEQRRREVLGE